MTLHVINNDADQLYDRPTIIQHIEMYGGVQTQGIQIYGGVQIMRAFRFIRCFDI